VLVEDLLTLARLDEVRDRPAEAVDVSQLVEDAAADTRALDPGRTIEVDAGDESIVLGDANQLRQVLANLLGNAVVHTPAGAPIEIAVRREDGSVELEVRDHGPGLPSEHPEELFERFWRRGATRAPAPAGNGEAADSGPEPGGRGGAGLGLAIVAGIVAAHGGSVRAANAAGGGATFVVRLPLAG
jgi:two-component system, OmpR family, sensor kinase